MNEAQVESISPAHLCLLLAAANPPELIDVRTPPEFANAHVPGAVLIPLQGLNAADYLQRHRAGTPIYVLCQSGSRARNAIERFRSRGCDDAVLVEGGTQAWIDAGLPVNCGTTKVLPIMRQVQIVAGSVSALGALLALVFNTWFAVIPLFIGSGLLFAGITGTCGMAILLARMPWNRFHSECLNLSRTPERS
jgi:rhodanese-related sulfurtransferase